MAIPQLFLEDAGLIHRARNAHITLLLKAGEQSYLLQLKEGRLEDVHHTDRPMDSCDITMAASDEDWQGYWQVMPKPGLHDIFAMAKSGRLRIEGNFRPLMRHLQVVKDVLALPRRLS